MLGYDLGEALRRWPNARIERAPQLPLELLRGRLVLLDSRSRHDVRRGEVSDFKIAASRGLDPLPPAVLEAAWADRPTLLEHACTDFGVPGRGGSNGPDAGDAGGRTVPHLVEHLAIDLLVERRRAHGQRGAVAGYTAWLDRASGLARVSIASPGPAVSQTAAVLACLLAAKYIDSVC